MRKVALAAMVGLALGIAGSPPVGKSNESVRPICAVVDPVRNKIVWFKRDLTVVRAWYQDGGERIHYSRRVPNVVKELVEERQGTRLRAKCS